MPSLPKPRVRQIGTVVRDALESVGGVDRFKPGDDLRGSNLEGIEAIASPDEAALIADDRIVSWREYARRGNNLARALRERGAQPDDKIAFYLRNCSEYMETLAASFKARLVHVNVNFRYLDDELAYILANSDARFVVFDVEFADRVASVRDRCTGVEHWIQVGGEVLPFAEPYEVLADTGDGVPLGIERSPDDLLFLYTGGTTGMPKAVMWRHEDLWGAVGSGSQNPANRDQRPATPEAHLAKVAAYGPGPRQLAACPLMHGTGLLAAIGNLLGAGTTATVAGERFNAVTLLDAVERHRINSIVIVGDTFARPILEALDADPGRWDLSSLKVMISSGVMWSREVKLALLRHQPKLVLADLFGSSEAIGFARSVTSAAGESATAHFEIGDGCKVFTEDHREVLPGSETPGFIARTGPIPLGYHKDPEESARTFPTIDDARWGQAVTAIVSLGEGCSFDEEALRIHVRDRLAAYKAPKRLFYSDQSFRGPNGKPGPISALISQ